MLLTADAFDNTLSGASYVKFQGKFWAVCSLYLDASGRISLTDLKDHSSGISADPKECRPATEAEADAIKEALRNPGYRRKYPLAPCI